MRQSLQFAVDFARYCIDNNVDPAKTIELVRIMESVVNAYERDTNGHRRKQMLEFQRDRFERAAKLQGYEVEWDSLIPTLTRNDRRVFLPRSA